ISEREPTDVEFDPSLNASHHALFLAGIQNKLSDFCSAPRTSSSIEQVVQFPEGFDNSPLADPPTKPDSNLQHSVRRWSSCSTIFIGDGCLIFPHQEATLWSVAVAVELLIQSKRNSELCTLVCSGPSTMSNGISEVSSNALQIYNEVYSLFDERKFSIVRHATDTNPRTFLIPGPDFSNNPEASDAHRFLRGLFSTALLGPQCAIVALIFLERLINAAEVGLLPWSWRRQMLACVLLASKVLDDQAVWNTDYCQILKDVSVDDLNALERHTLSLLQFNIDVPVAVYARYYFDLLSAGEARGVANRPAERRRLTPELARDLRILTPRSESHTDADAELNTRLLFDLPCTEGRFTSETRRHNANRKNRRSKVHNIRTHKAFVSSPLHHLHKQDVVDGVFENRPLTTSICDSANLATLPSNEVDEGPLVLDEETDFINGLTVSPFVSVNDNILYDDCFDNVVLHSCVSRKSHPRSPVHINRPFSHTPYTHLIGSTGDLDPLTPVCQAYNQLDTLTPHSNFVPTTSTGFIRSLMGGEVAYSLLRDAGIY
ncbi:hypothetical protein EG68_04305, partial [Paragonimus skrjabini miyazakii]